ncbi:MAG: tyrosine-type recombinase/integrase [Kordiimonadaceae bacterium]|nr:tyrosine-type recombinase/integrase [Kordiimonadaceae bacterium]
MASIFKDKTKWRVQVRRKGVSISENFRTKAAAQRWAYKTETDIDEGRITETKVDGRTVEDALLEYSKRVTIHKRSVLWEQRRLKWFMQSNLAELRLDKINASDVARFRDDRLLVVSGSTVNRDFNLLSNVFTYCVDEWLWMAKNPCSKLKRPKDNPARERRVSTDEIATMRHVLHFEEDKAPETQQEFIALAWLISLETAMRLGEVNSIEEGLFYEAKCYVQLENTKNGDRRKVVLNKRAIELIELLLLSPDKQNSHNLSKCFENAVKRSGIRNMTFHDSRHEAITRLAQKLNVLDLARTTGIRDLKQLMVYYDATPEEMAAKLD